MKSNNWFFSWPSCRSGVGQCNGPLPPPPPPPPPPNTDASHRCISSFKSSPLQGKVRKKPLLGLIPNLTCDVLLPFHITSTCRKFSQFVTLCKELQEIKINYNKFTMICKLCIFKSYSRHDTFLSRILLLVIDKSLFSRNTYMSRLLNFFKVKVLIYRLVAFRSLTCIFT